MRWFNVRWEKERKEAFKKFKVSRGEKDTCVCVYTCDERKKHVEEKKTDEK